MRNPNLAVMPSHAPISKQPDTNPTDAVRQFLVEAGEVYQRQITSALIGIWQRELSHIPAPKLRAAMSKVLRECKFFPTVADISKAVETLGMTEMTEMLLSRHAVDWGNEESEKSAGCEECRHTGFVVGPDNKARLCECRKRKGVR
jgi:hypothetical protein